MMEASASVSFAPLLLLAMGVLLYHLFAKTYAKGQSPKTGQTTVDPDSGRMAELMRYRELYFKLHNLEQYPEVVYQAREELDALLLQASVAKPSKRGITAHARYDSSLVRKHLSLELDIELAKWKQYIQRRKSGGSRELIFDHHDGVLWLKRTAPLRYVDGAWLGHINRITVPFDHKDSRRIAFQIFSEEYGDGDSRKHHAHVFHQLIRNLVPGFPYPDSDAFIQPATGMDDVSVWMAAVTQLVIALWPDSFFAELLGFNMHFELIKLQTLVAAKELKEVDIDPYYFTLHVSIDNADTGHTAMALQAVEEYLATVLSTSGVEEQQKAWERIQAGYALSHYLENPSRPGTRSEDPLNTLPRMHIGAAAYTVAEIFRAKSRHARVHCGSRIQLGGRLLADWLGEEHMSSPQRRLHFLQLLGKSSWVTKGNSEGSRLIKELLWGGRMFGAFTSSEVDTLKDWIDSWTEERPLSARLWTNPSTCFTAYRWFLGASASDMMQTSGRVLRVDASDQKSTTTDPTRDIHMTQLLPLWFISPCLLHGLISMPFRSITRDRCAILKIVLAQSGLPIESTCVAGTNEARPTSPVGLLELGLAMARRAGYEDLYSTADVLARWPCVLAMKLLLCSNKPIANAQYLIGFAWAFIDLHELITETKLLDAKERITLRSIAQRERAGLTDCLAAFDVDSDTYHEICRAHRWLSLELEWLIGHKK